jgi:hypothetical protein
MANAEHDKSDEREDSPDGEFWQQVDAFIQPFEKAWQQGPQPCIDDFLPENGSERLRLAAIHPRTRRSNGPP